MGYPPYNKVGYGKKIYGGGRYNRYTIGELLLLNYLIIIIIYIINSNKLCTVCVPICTKNVPKRGVFCTEKGVFRF